MQIPRALPSVLGTCMWWHVMACGGMWWHVVACGAHSWLHGHTMEKILHNSVKTKAYITGQYGL